MAAFFFLTTTGRLRGAGGLGTQGLHPSSTSRPRSGENGLTGSRPMSSPAVAIKIGRTHRPLSDSAAAPKSEMSESSLLLPE